MINVNKRDYDSVYEFLDKLIKVFRLKDWDIDLLFDNSLNTDAGTHLVYNDYKATIKIKADVCEEEQKLSLVHEIIHIILRNSQCILDENIKNEDVNKILNRELERETEKLAKGIYSLLEKVE